MTKNNPYIQIGNVYFLSMILYFFSWRFGIVSTPMGFVIFGTLYMWVPGIVALINARQEKIKLHFWAWPHLSWIILLSLPLLLAVTATALSGLFVGFEGVEGLRTFFSHIVGAESALPLTTRELLFLAFIVTLVSGITINFVSASGEELFWRGYLWHHLKEEGFWKGSFIIGLAWGVWHWPLVYFQGYNYPGHPYMGCLMMTLVCVLLSPLLTFVRVQGRCIAVTAICHGLINATPWLWMSLLSSTDTLFVGLLGINGLIVLAFFNMLLFFYFRRDVAHVVVQ